MNNVSHAMNQNADHHTHSQSQLHSEHDQNNPSLISQASSVIQQVYFSSHLFILFIFINLRHLYDISIFLVECRLVDKWRTWHKEQPTLWKTLSGWVRPATALAARLALTALANPAPRIFKRNYLRILGQIFSNIKKK